MQDKEPFIIKEPYASELIRRLSGNLTEEEKIQEEKRKEKLKDLNIKAIWDFSDK